MGVTTASPDLKQIVARLGGDLYNGGNAALVPGPGHSPKDRSLSLKVTPDGRLIWHSHANDDASKVWAHLGISHDLGRRMTPFEIQRARADRDRAAKERERLAKIERARTLAFCRQVWSETVPAAGSPAEAYLRGRGVVGAIPETIRFHPKGPFDYRRAKLHPSMVAIITGPDGKSAVGLHVTALRADGSGKAAIKNPRHMFGQVTGGVVQIGAFPADGVLAVGEGLETSLSYRDLTGTPTWAALSTSGLKSLAIPLGVRKLIIAADGDKAGHEAALALAEKARKRCDVMIIPAPEGQDWNDVLKGGKQ